MPCKPFEFHSDLNKNVRNYNHLFQEELIFVVVFSLEKTMETVQRDSVEWTRFYAIIVRFLAIVTIDTV